jgi:hypothetical protein
MNESVRCLFGYPLSVMDEFDICNLFESVSSWEDWLDWQKGDEWSSFIDPDNPDSKNEPAEEDLKILKERVDSFDLSFLYHYSADYFFSTGYVLKDKKFNEYCPLEVGWEPIAYDVRKGSCGEQDEVQIMWEILEEIGQTEINSYFFMNSDTSIPNSKAFINFIDQKLDYLLQNSSEQAIETFIEFSKSKEEFIKSITGK